MTSGELRQERAARNQSLFREVNERVEDLNRAADDGLRADVVCECRDRDCIEKIELTPAEYESVRRAGTRFVVLPGHVSEGERVVVETDRFVIVEKLGAGAAVAEQLDPRSEEPSAGRTGLAPG